VNAERPLRLFVACDLPGDGLAAITDWQRAELAPHAELRAVRTLHLTLAFLGNVGAERVPDITGALGALAIPRLEAAVSEPLFLPERGRKHVVALRLDDPSGALVTLQRDVSEALRQIGAYTPEKRPWLPHVTVARYRRPGPPFSLQNVTIGRVGLPSVILYASVLERGGAVHTPLATFPVSP
jgi:2'-5' RNA ligase